MDPGKSEEEQWHLAVRVEEHIVEVRYAWVPLFDIEKRIPETVALTETRRDEPLRIPVKLPFVPGMQFIVLHAAYANGRDGYGLVTKKHFSDTYTDSRGHKVRSVSLLAKPPLAWVKFVGPDCELNPGGPFTGDAIRGFRPEALISKVYSTLHRNASVLASHRSSSDEATVANEALVLDLVRDTLAALAAPLAFKVLYEQNRAALSLLHSPASAALATERSPWGVAVLWRPDGSHEAERWECGAGSADSGDYCARVSLTRHGILFAKLSGARSQGHLIRAPYWGVVLAALCCGALERWRDDLRAQSRLLRITVTGVTADQACQRCGHPCRVAPPLCDDQPRRVAAVLQIDKLLLGPLCTTLCAAVPCGNQGHGDRGRYCLNHRRAYRACAEEKRERRGERSHDGEVRLRESERGGRPQPGDCCEGRRTRPRGRAAGERRCRGIASDPIASWWTTRRCYWGQPFVAEDNGHGGSARPQEARAHHSPEEPRRQCHWAGRRGTAGASPDEDEHYDPGWWLWQKRCRLGKGDARRQSSVSGSAADATRRRFWDLHSPESKRATRGHDPERVSTSHRSAAAAGSSLDDALRSLDTLVKNFAALATWFEKFEATEACAVVGFDLAMEVFGCYDLTVSKSVIDFQHSLKRADEEVTGELERVRAALARAEGERDGALGELARATGELERDRAALARAEGERDVALGELARATGEMERVRAALARAEGERDGALGELARATGELERDRAALARAEGERRAALDKERSLALLYEECRDELYALRDRMSSLQEELKDAQKAVESREALMRSLKKAHEADALEWSTRRNELTRESVSREELELRVAELERFNDALSAARAEESESAKAECARARVLLDEHRLASAQLCDDLRRCEMRNRELMSRVESLDSEVAGKQREVVDIHRSKRILHDLLRYLGVAPKLVDPWVEIRSKVEQSVTRLTEALRLAFEAPGSPAHSCHGQEGEGMDFELAAGQLFHDYEERVRAYLVTLHSESAKRERRVVARRAKRSFSSVSPSGRKPDAAGTGRDLQTELKREKVPRAVFKNEGSTLTVAGRDANALECQTRGAFLVEDGQIDALRTVKIPRYLRAALKRRGGVKVVDLGHDSPLRKLLGVLQIDNAEALCPEIEPTECHCLQMERLASLLDCRFFVCWNAGGGYEMYGAEKKESGSYVVVASKGKVLTSYFLVCLSLGNSLHVTCMSGGVFDTTFLPARVSHGHAPSGTCRGPHRGADVEQDEVQAIETRDIVLIPHE
ncbi:hypothetical protein WMY93_031108 [Mugilogobius chulae]|uniref:Uncharacterized protein n=1 Tax=Mugilogobius chulae TaxID=88201 RepID=A0AAW0MNF3_9GOBI